MKTSQASSRHDGRTYRAKADYRRVVKATQRGCLDLRKFERPERRDNDIEITSTGTFVWIDGRAVPK